MRKMLFRVLKNNYIISAFVSLFIYANFLLQGYLSFSGFLSWMLFLILFIFCNYVLKTTKFNKKNLLLSVIVSSILVIGRNVLTFENMNNVNIIAKVFSLKSILMFLGNSGLLYLLFQLLMSKIELVKIKDSSLRKRSLRIFLLSLLLILLCWLIYFLAYYPGLLTSDSISELHTVIDNFKILSNHHPLFHIIIIYIPFSIGKFLFHSRVAGIATATFFQMIIMASIYAYLIYFLYSRGIKKSVLFFVFMYFALVPLNAIYSIVMWKDIIYSGTLLLLTIETYKLLELKSLKAKNMISFTIISIINLFLRNNAIYAYLILATITLLIFRKNIKIITASLVIVLGSYYIVTGPVFDLLNVYKSSSSEYIAIPLQQVGRIVWKNAELTTKEKQTINELIPIEELKKTYTPFTVDTIKFNSSYNSEVFENNKAEYAKLWATLTIKHPLIASEAYLSSTLGYWYPDLIYDPIVKEISLNDLNIKTRSKLPHIKRVLDRLINEKSPLINSSYSMGLCFWILILLAYITKQKRGWKYVYCFVPVFAMWFTIMIAAPVNGELRYVYGLYTTLPFLAVMTFLSKDKIRGERNEKK